MVVAGCFGAGSLAFRSVPGDDPGMRSLFSIPRDVAYLNAAAYGPLPDVVRDAGVAGAAGKSLPWTLDRPGAEMLAERVRAGAARLIGAETGDVAIMGSVSHGMATAGRVLAKAGRVGRGSRIVRVAGEQSSQALEWQRLAAEQGAELEIVARPSDHDWTSAVLERVEAAGAAPVSVAALTPLHWTDGTLIDLVRIGAAVRRQGGALVVDATQAAGAVPIEVRRLEADFLAYPTYKWVLGSYNLAFLYAAPQWQQGEPLERNGYNCEADAAVVDVAPKPGARRYDMGERNNPVALPMADAALGLVLGWGVAEVERRLRRLTDRLAAVAEGLGFGVAPGRLRAPHILGVRVPGGAGALLEGLAARGVFVSDRQGVLRVSPHVYNDEEDVERFGAALAAVTKVAAGRVGAAA